jgi:NDP-sugar pyrophosphorylase family protein
MQALILAGGQGTRLRPLTINTPKPILPIANRPFLLYQIERLRETGITDIILALNYKPAKIEEILGDGSTFGVKIRYLVEPSPLGTAGAYRFASDFINQTTIVLNGDILTDLDISAAVEKHKNRRAAATIVLTKVENPLAYGLVETTEDGRIKRFLEKPNPEELAKIKLDTINAGTYILEPKVLDLIPKGENYSFEYGVFPALLNRREEFFGYLPNDTYWLDIGTPQRYLQAHHDLLAGKVRDFKEKTNFDTISLTENVEIDGKSIIAEDCVIKFGAKIINSVLGRGVFVEENAVIKNSVILSNTKISTSVSISDSIIGNECNIGSHCIVRAGTVLGDMISL